MLAKKWDPFSLLKGTPILPFMTLLNYPGLLNSCLLIPVNLTDISSGR